MRAGAHAAARTADVLSLLLNPSIWGGGFVAFLAVRFQPPGPARFLMAVAGFVSIALLPVASLFLLRARGILHDLEMRDRRERGAVYMACTASYVAGAAVLLAAGAPWPVWGVVAVHAPAALVLAGLNRRSKVSIHAAGLAGVLAAAIVLFGLSAWPLAAVAAAGAWARWAAGAHTARDLLLGAAVGLVVTGLGLFLIATLLGA